MYSLHYLAFLVMKKNDLNRKRRRFYALKNPGRTAFKLHPADERFKLHENWKSFEKFDDNYQKVIYKEPFVWHSVDKPTHPSYSKVDAERGYRKAQAEMKAMTAHMRAVRKELDAYFIWGSGGQINAIVHDGKTYWQCWANVDSDEPIDGWRPQFKLRSDIADLAEHHKAELALKSA